MYITFKKKTDLILINMQLFVSDNLLGVVTLMTTNSNASC